MKTTSIVAGLTLLITASLFGQTQQTTPQLIDFLDPASQTNIIIFRNGEVSLPCPPQYINLISNTNLFSPADQKLVQEAILKYKNVTTNSGPPGSILASLNKDTNGCWVALFQYTNLDAQDEVTFGVRISAKYSSKANKGYEVDISSPGGDAKPDIAICQLSQGIPNGLSVTLSGEERCLSWLHFSNGMAVGKWLEWERLDNGLSLEAEFKSPYDIKKHLIPLNMN